MEGVAQGGRAGHTPLPSSALPPPWDPGLPSSPEFPLFSYNNGVVMRSCRELDNSRSGLSAASAFAIATSGANEGTPNKEKYRRMSLASTGAGRGLAHPLSSWAACAQGRPAPHGARAPPPTRARGGPRWAGTGSVRQARGRR